MVDRWLDNGWRLLAGLISRNVPANSFSPRAIRNRCPILFAIRSIAHVLTRSEDYSSGDGRDELEHDPEKWVPVFGKDHAQTTC
jgi:hypothetical protein